MKRVIFLQVSDYRDTYSALAQGKPETYFSQKIMIDFPASLLNKHDVCEVCVVSFMGSTEYDQIMPNGVRAVNIPFCPENPKQNKMEAARFIDVYKPTHAVVQVPVLGIVKKCIQNKIKTYIMIADSFTGNGFRGLILCRMFAWLLNNKNIELVSNHNYPASNILKDFGVKAEKIIPWDFAWQVRTDEYAVKDMPVKPKIWRFFYAGRILTEKGVGDIIQAMSLLKQEKIEANAVFAGSGNIPDFKKQAADLGISDRVNFLGSIAHQQVLSGMRGADMVIIPSQIRSSEGMPCTIYESFIVKTPIIISDHPVMRKKIKNCEFFKAGDPKALVKAISRLINEPLLYRKLSAGSESALRELIVPFSFVEIVDHWLSGQEADKQWLLAHSLRKSK